MGNRALVIGAYTYPAAALQESTVLRPHDSIRISAEEYQKAIEDNDMWGPGSCGLLKNPRSAGEVWSYLDACIEGLTASGILLVVYIGHGGYWKEVPGGSVHFALSSSVDKYPDTWLSTWYLYWRMRKAGADRLKVLIADCCYSNLMGALGGAANQTSKMPPPRGTAVFTALGGAGSTVDTADPDGCPDLDSKWADCTLFSGHFLKVLNEGVPGGRYLTLGSLRDAVETAMTVCTTHGDHLPRLLTNDAREDQPLFANTNRSAREPRPLRGPDDWVEALSKERGRDLEELLRSPRDAAIVQLRLGAVDTEIAKHNVERISQQAEDKLSATAFVRYETELRRGGQT
jgi:hypothetical protein